MKIRIAVPKWAGPAAGLLVIVSGAGSLLASARPLNLRRPNAAVVVLGVAGLALHLFENRGEPHPGLLLWSLLPYAFALGLSAFPALRRAAIAGAAVALAVDGLAHYLVFVRTQSSTAALALVFFPLWSTLAFVPAATLLAWLVLRWRTAGRQ